MVNVIQCLKSISRAHLFRDFLSNAKIARINTFKVIHIRFVHDLIHSTRDLLCKVFDSILIQAKCIEIYKIHLYYSLQIFV